MHRHMRPCSWWTSIADFWCIRQCFANKDSDGGYWYKRCLWWFWFLYLCLYFCLIGQFVGWYWYFQQQPKLRELVDLVEGSNLLEVELEFDCPEALSDQAEFVVGSGLFGAVFGSD